MVKYLPRETVGKVRVDFLHFPTDLCDLCAQRTGAGEKLACVKHPMSAGMSYGDLAYLAHTMETMPESVLYMTR